jgi:hypothetical protein
MAGLPRRQTFALPATATFVVVAAFRHYAASSQTVQLDAEKSERRGAVDGTGYPHRPSVGHRSVSAGLDYGRSRILVRGAMNIGYAYAVEKFGGVHNDANYFPETIYGNSVAMPLCRLCIDIRLYDCDSC